MKKKAKGKNKRRKGPALLSVAVKLEDSLTAIASGTLRAGLLPSLSGIRSARRLADGYQDSATSLQEGGLRDAACEHDPVERPSHYTSHPSGIECIQVTEHMGFNLGNAVKYVWRADLKGKAIEDLKKAVWYIEREIQRREKKNGDS